MSRLELFAKRISQINGVESYILVRRSGEILKHNMSNPDDIASMVTICGNGSSDVMQSIGFSRFSYLTLNRIDHRNFLIFFLDRLLLGVQQISGTDDQNLAAEISLFLEKVIFNRRRQEQN